MTVLTPTEINKQYGATKSEIDKYFKDHRGLKRTPINVHKVKDRIKASKISRATGKEASFTQSDAEWQVIYGTTRVGGVITAVFGSGDQLALHLVVTLAGHKISSIDKLFLDDEEVVFGGAGTFDSRWSSDIIRKDGTRVSQSATPTQALNKIFMSPTLGNVGQAANSDMMGQAAVTAPKDSKGGALPGWTSAHTQDGCAYAYIILGWDAILFPDGPPEFTFQVTGKPVKNPATSTTTASSNAADILVDYLMDTRYGLAIPESEIDSTTWLAAHNKCAELVTIINPVPGQASTEARYTVDGAFKSSETPESFVTSMCAAMSGTITWIGGKWYIYAGSYVTAPVLLTKSDLLSDVKIQTKLSRKESFNGVKGTFLAGRIGTTDNYDETDFPAVKNDYYMQLDNNERVWEDVQYLLTNSPSRAQRLAKIELERNRQAITVQVTASLKAYQAQPFEIIGLRIDELGWYGKEFLIQSMTPVLQDGGSGVQAIAIELQLRETGVGVYTWNDGDETRFDIAPNTFLPNPLATAAITNITLASGTDQLYVRGDGTVANRIKVGWNAIGDYFTTSGGSIEVNYKKSADNNWIAMALIAGDSTNAYIFDVQEYYPPTYSTYDVRVRTRNALNVYGAWTTVTGYHVIGKAAPPSDVQGLRGTWEVSGVRLYWNAISDADVAGYKIKYGPATGTWSDAQTLGQVTATSFATAITTAADYMFMVKALDTSGNESLHEARLAVDITAPTAPGVTATIEGTDLVLSWMIPSSDFQIEHYIISYGIVTEDDPIPSLATSIPIMTTKTTSIRMPITWAGTRWFWVKGIDINDNIGDPGVVTVTIEAPGTPLWQVNEVIDNNVLLRWKDSNVGTLPTSFFQVFKGAGFASAELIGETAGTFATHFEQVAGAYTYWLVAIDTAGNKSTPAQVTLNVDEPPDFILRNEGVLDAREARVATNVYIEDYGFITTGTGVSGPGGVGSPLGLLLALTVSGSAPAGPGGTAGMPMGLLMALTYSTPSSSGATHRSATPKVNLTATLRTPSATTTEKHKVALPLATMTITKNVPGASTNPRSGSPVGILLSITHN